MAEANSLRMYCLKCRDHREITSPMPKTIKGKKGTRYMMQGKCPECASVVSTFVKPPSSDVQTTIPDGGHDDLPDEPESAQSEAEVPPTLVITDEIVWLGMCRLCRVEREFKGDYIGMRWDGNRVINAMCQTCQLVQVVVGVRDRDEEVPIG